MSTPLSQARSLPRFAEAAVERARLTVVPRSAQKAPRVPFVSLVSLLLVAGVAGLLLFNTNMQQASFVATSMEEQAAVLAGKEESLRMQLDRLRDPQHVAARAKKLGMVPASNPAFIRLSDGRVLGSPSVATPTETLRIAPLPPVKPASLRPRFVIAELPEVANGGTQGARDTITGQGQASRDDAVSSRTKNENAAGGAGQSRGRTP
jgi:hypothetical protein